MARISKYLDVVFDVGANRGNWSALVLSSAPEARIHAFEIVPDVHADLAAANGDRCIVNDFGLSDKEEEIDVIFSASEDTRSRMIIDERMDKDFKTVKCSVKVGDEYCIERGVEAIDLLKIDVEGAEHRVLFGFKGMIERGKVACIQFEYNHARLHSRFLLSDFYAFLQHEYEIGRLSPQGVVFKDYELTDEDFCGPNYVAVRKDRPDLISAVAAGS